jgi:hypothetical protein
MVGAWSVGFLRALPRRQRRRLDCSPSTSQSRILHWLPVTRLWPSCASRIRLPCTAQCSEAVRIAPHLTLLSWSALTCRGGCVCPPTRARPSQEAVPKTAQPTVLCRGRPVRRWGPAILLLHSTGARIGSPWRGVACSTACQPCPSLTHLPHVGHPTCPTASALWSVGMLSCARHG